MKIVNHTTIPRDVLAEMLVFAAPSGVAGFTATFRNSRHSRCHGHAWWGGRGSIMIHVPRTFSENLDLRFRLTERPKREQRWKGKGYMTDDCFTAREQLLDLIAHELRHLWQHRVPRGWRCWGSRGRYSEKDCDAYAIRKTREWRRREIPHEKMLERVTRPQQIAA